jgi:ribosomal protein L31
MAKKNIHPKEYDCVLKLNNGDELMIKTVNPAEKVYTPDIDNTNHKVFLTLRNPGQNTTTYVNPNQKKFSARMGDVQFVSSGQEGK